MLRINFILDKNRPLHHSQPMNFSAHPRTKWLHTSSIGLAALGFAWYRSSHPGPLKKSPTADMTASSGRYCFPAKCFFNIGEQMVLNQGKLEGDQPLQSHSHAPVAAIATTDLCAAALSWWNRTPYVSFAGCLRNVSSTTCRYFSKSKIYNFLTRELFMPPLILNNGKRLIATETVIPRHALLYKWRTGVEWISADWMHEFNFGTV